MNRFSAYPQQYLTFHFKLKTAYCKTTKMVL